MSEFKGKKTVQLRLYKGAESYDKNGKLTSETQDMTLTYGDIMWARNLKNLKFLGLSKIEVTGYLEGEDVKDVPNNINDEVQFAFNGGVKVELTPDQKRIAELEATVAELAKAAKKPAAK